MSKCSSSSIVCVLEGFKMCLFCRSQGHSNPLRTFTLRQGKHRAFRLRPFLTDPGAPLQCYTYRTWNITFIQEAKRMKDTFPHYTRCNRMRIFCASKIEKCPPNTIGWIRVLHDYALILLFENWYTIWQLDSRGVLQWYSNKSKCLSHTELSFPKVKESSHSKQS